MSKYPELGSFALFSGMPYKHFVYNYTKNIIFECSDTDTTELGYQYTVKSST